jgi:hypothetical protein
VEAVEVEAEAEAEAVVARAAVAAAVQVAVAAAVPVAVAQVGRSAVSALRLVVQQPLMGTGTDNTSADRGETADTVGTEHAPDRVGRADKGRTAG